MSIAVVTLVLITSAGIFGFLSNAYQGATVDFEKQSTALLYRQDRLDQLLDDKVFLKEELDAAISELPENYRTAKRKLREEYQPQISQINKDILALKGEVGELKIALVETGVDVGPAIYLARIFNTDVDSVVKFFIFILIFVFDPMAVMFVISYNVTLQDRYKTSENTQSEKRKNGNKWWEVYGEKKKKSFKNEVAETIKNDNRLDMKEKLDDIKKQPDSSLNKLKKGGFSRQKK